MGCGSEHSDRTRKTDLATQSQGEEEREAVLTQAGPELRKADHQFPCLVRAGEAYGGRGYPSSIG